MVVVLHLEARDISYLSTNLEPEPILTYCQKNPSMVVVARKGRKAVGFCVGHGSSLKKWIVKLHVEPTLQGRGIGQMMVAHLLQSHPGAVWGVRLRDDEQSLTPFFAKAGFITVENLNLYRRKNTKPVDNHSNTFDQHISIDKADESDFLGLSQLEHLCFDHYWWNTTEDWRKFLTNDNYITYVARDEPGDQVVGFVYNSTKGIGKRKEGQLIRLAVAPAYRRHHLGTALTNKSMEWFDQRGTKVVYLSTIRDNQTLNAMYRKWGFRLFGEEAVLTHNKT